MSFNSILVLALIIMAGMTPVICVFAFEKGYKLGVKDFNRAHPDEPKAEIHERKAKKPAVKDEKLQMYSQILENIDNYDGTTANQKDVKVV